MFTFSKVITLGVLLAGTTGLSTYLIPYSLGEKAKDFLFSSQSDSNVSENIKDFSEKEKKMLETLNPLLEELEKAVKNSINLKDIKDGKMKEFFQKILETENKLIDFHNKNLKIIQKLSSTLKEISNQNENKLKIQSNLKTINYLKNLLNQLDKFIKAQEKLLSSVVKEIDRNNSESSESRGGHKILRMNIIRKLVKPAEMQKMH
ncbi:hypothetical protein [Mycoplasma suis]|uniref:Uncharacterized protein n=1 Tax=Mycoplasma suis (strain Illinois) TaxID=768700 RepID=F0QRQ8_MYCSL|nr:hypothetical protein [Mycoplasma suis]ADX98178.1 hypothetical protein MSU_0647 [Mycoplasma suis str. Illinois]